MILLALAPVLAATVAPAQMSRLVACGIVGPTDSEHPGARLFAVHWEPRFGLHPAGQYEVWLKPGSLDAVGPVFALAGHAGPTSSPQSIRAAVRFGPLGLYAQDLERLLREIGALAPEEGGIELAVERMLAALADPRLTPFPSATALGRANPVAGWALGETLLLWGPAGTVVSVKLTDAAGTLLGLVELDTTDRTRLASPGALAAGAATAGADIGQASLELVIAETEIAPLREQACRVQGLRLYRHRGIWAGPPPDDDALFAQLSGEGKIEVIGPLTPFDFAPPGPAQLLDPAAPIDEPLAYWVAATDLLGQRGTLSPTLQHTVTVEGGGQ